MSNHWIRLTITIIFGVWLILSPNVFVGFFFGAFLARVIGSIVGWDRCRDCGCA